MKNFKKSLFATLMMGFMFSTTQAGTNSTTFEVKTAIQGTCTLSATDIDFGNVVLATSGNANTTSTITVTCSKNTFYALTLDAGLNSSDFTPRKMSWAAWNGGSYTPPNTEMVEYNLYSDAAHTTILADSNYNNGNNQITNTSNGTAVNHTVYASMPLNQNVSVGYWSDTITVQLYY